MREIKNTLSNIELELKKLNKTINEITERDLEGVAHNSRSLLIDDYYNNDYYNKDYYLKVEDSFFEGFEEDVYLNYNQLEGEFGLSGKSEMGNWQTKFTKEEMDDLGIIEENFILVEA